MNASPAQGVARQGSFEEVPVRPPDDAPMEINGAGRVGSEAVQRTRARKFCAGVPQTYVYICIYIFLCYFANAPDEIS